MLPRCDSQSLRHRNFAHATMSESIKHECGIAFVRLRKPLNYFLDKYGTRLYGLNKLYLLMEKQHNRGQDGAGVASVKLNPKTGTPYIYRHRSDRQDGIRAVYEKVHEDLASAKYWDADLNETAEIKRNYPFLGELLMGHLRYATHGNSGESFCHPFIRQSNWMSKNLVMAGNFNLTNNDELVDKLISLGQHPENTSDTVTVLEKIGHFLDEEVNELYAGFRSEGKEKTEIPALIEKHLDMANVLRRSARDFDGGYAMLGLCGAGQAFVLRDPNGIRPAFWYEDDEVVIATSERPAIKTAFNVDYADIKEIPAGHALIVAKDGTPRIEEIVEPRELLQCSFERIYFSRGNDKYIYRERKDLGKLLALKVLNEVNWDLDNTVFSYIPNTAEVAFYGMMEQVDDVLNEYKRERILEGKLSPIELDNLLRTKARTEKIAVKDAKLRTFITSDNQRNDLVTHVYDTTYGVLKRDQDTLVIIDDSIVRGTTLRNSIVRILDRLHPKKIIIVSSAPQIRYPDCYGIDMSRLGEFVAFRAAIELLEETGQASVIQTVYDNCVKDRDNPTAPNHVTMIYAPFTDDEISEKISSMLRPADLNAELKIIFQSVDDLHLACPEHLGDWYFTGRYPTPGGNRVSNRSFMNFIEKSNARAY